MKTNKNKPSKPEGQTWEIVCRFKAVVPFKQSLHEYVAEHYPEIDSIGYDVQTERATYGHKKGNKKAPNFKRAYELLCDAMDDILCDDDKTEIYTAVDAEMRKCNL